MTRIGTHKTCNICKETKPVIDFVVNERKCKLCLKLKNQLYYKNKIQLEHPKPIGRPRKIKIETLLITE